MSQWLKQSTSIAEKIGPFLDDTDGFTAETGLTITQPDIRLSKNGGAFAQKAAAQTLAHDENGFYGLTLDDTDTDTLGRIKGNVHKTGALPVFFDFMVVPANVWDSMFGADKLQIDLAQWLGTAAATPTVAGVPEVDLTHVMGTILAEGAGGRLAAAFNKLFDVATPTLVASDVMRGTNNGATETKQDIIDAIVDLIKLETDKIALGDAGSGAAGSVIEEVENRATPAQVNTEVADVLTVDTHTLPAQVAPPLTPTLLEMQLHLYKPWRNYSEQDGTQQRLYANDGTTVDQKRTVNKTTGGTVELGKVESGPA